MKSIHHPQSPEENSPSPSNPALKLFSDFAFFTLTGRSFQSGKVLFKKKLSLILPILAGSLWKHTPSSLNCFPVVHNFSFSSPVIVLLLCVARSLAYQYPFLSISALDILNVALLTRYIYNNLTDSASKILKTISQLGNDRFSRFSSHDGLIYPLRATWQQDSKIPFD